MTLAYIVSGGMNDHPGIGLELYENNPDVRRLYEQVREWTGYEAMDVLSGEFPEETNARNGFGAIRQAAAVLACQDLLEQKGIRPSVVTGTSVGGMIAACLAGGVDRRDLFRFFRVMQEVPPLQGPTQCVAVLVVPAEDDPHQYYDGVHLAADLGITRAGTTREVVIAGYRSAMDEVASRLPAGMLHVFPGQPIAPHTPLMRPTVDFLAPHLAAMEFRTPDLPVVSCLDPVTITTSEGLRDLFMRNPVDPVSVLHQRKGLVEHGVRLGVVLGPVAGYFADNFPFPVTGVERSDDVAPLIEAVYELGITV